MIKLKVRHNSNYKYEIDYLEDIYRKVKVSEAVKFNGKVYRRIRPIKNRHIAYAYHFYCQTNNIYNGTALLLDQEGELVNTICEYKLEVV